VAQEALANVIRHAHATRGIHTARNKAGEYAVLAISDNGKGFDPEPHRLAAIKAMAVV